MSRTLHPTFAGPMYRAKPHAAQRTLENEPAVLDHGVVVQVRPRRQHQQTGNNAVDLRSLACCVDGV